MCNKMVQDQSNLNMNFHFLIIHRSVLINYRNIKIKHSQIYQIISIIVSFMIAVHKAHITVKHV